MKIYALIGLYSLAAGADAVTLRDFVGRYKSTNPKCSPLIELVEADKGLNIFKLQFDDYLDFDKRLPFIKERIRNITTLATLTENRIELKTEKMARRTSTLLSKESFTLSGELLTFSSDSCVYKKGPSGARLTYQSIKETFDNFEELLNVENQTKIFGQIGRIKSATRKYHRELFQFIPADARLTLEQIKMIPRLAYFTPEDYLAIVRTLAPARDRYSSRASDAELALALENQKLANALTPIIINIIRTHAGDVQNLSLQEYVSFMKAMPREPLSSKVNSVILQSFEYKLAALRPNEVLSLIAFYELNTMPQDIERIKTKYRQ